MPFVAERGILVERMVLEVKKLKVYILVVAMLAVLVGCGGEASAPSSQQKDQLPEEDLISKDADSISAKFQELGFTEEEATEIAYIFSCVGLTEIGEITPAVGSGIDKLQSFIIPVFGSEQMQANIAVENRKLCSIELAGIGAYQPEFYISVFGNAKVRKKQTVKTVLLFDRWDGDAVKEIADSYVAKIDYENMEIVNFN